MVVGVACSLHGSQLLELQSDLYCVICNHLIIRSKPSVWFLTVFSEVIHSE